MKTFYKFAIVRFAQDISTYFLGTKQSLHELYHKI